MPPAQLATRSYNSWKPVTSGWRRQGHLRRSCDVAGWPARATGTGDDGATYELTGPERVSYADAAGRLGKAIGTPVKLVDVPRDAARADLLSAGLPSSQADALLMLFDGIRAGKVYPPTQTVADLLSRPGRSLDDWLADLN